MVFVAAVLCVLGAGVQPAGKTAAKPPVPFPHPLITEVLYGVPSGADGDANKDGQRSATGDEFVELINPHDKPIQLGGYVLTDGTPLRPLDRSPEARTQIRFVFPEFELKPGQVVVVFNGYKQNIPGPVGDAAKAPADPNPGFANALVFSMKAPSQYVAFNNEGDCVVLRDPRGKAINTVRWGGYNGGSLAGAVLAEDAPEGLGSVQRVGLSKQLASHPDLKPGVLFSPGEFDLAAEPVVATRRPAKPPAKPAAKPASETKAAEPQAGG